jgi:hypothetical protein
MDKTVFVIIASIIINFFKEELIAKMKKKGINNVISNEENLII